MIHGLSWYRAPVLKLGLQKKYDQVFRAAWIGTQFNARRAAKLWALLGS